MSADPSSRQISTRKGVLLIAVFIAGITLVSLVRHWSQAQVSAGGIAVQTSDGQRAVAIFTTDSCTYCRAAKKFLEQKRVAYTEFNLDRSDKARQVFGMLGGRGVPLIIVGEQRLVGFDQQSLTRLLVEQGFLR
jgi:glutaredoxin